MIFCICHSNFTFLLLQLSCLAIHQQNNQKSGQESAIPERSPLRKAIHRLNEAMVDARAEHIRMCILKSEFSLYSVTNPNFCTLVKIKPNNGW